MNFLESYCHETWCLSDRRAEWPLLRRGLCGQAITPATLLLLMMQRSPIFIRQIKIEYKV